MKEEQSTNAGLLQGFSSWQHLSRFLIAVLITLFLLLIFAYLILHKLRSVPVSIEFTSGGATVVKVKEKPSKALYLLAAGRLWANTGIELNPNQEVLITASGYINLAFHRLAESADIDRKPRHGWTGPEGGPLKKETGLDRRREALLIDPKIGYGTLLAYVRPRSTAPPGIRNPVPDGIQVVGKCQRIRNRSKEPGELWLVVNEAVLSDTEKAHNAYVTDQAILNEAYGFKDSDGTIPKLTVEEMERRWEYIRAQSYWDVWWDDNIGEFLVQFDFSPTAQCANEQNVATK